MVVKPTAVYCQWCGKAIRKPRSNQTYCCKQCRLDHKQASRGTNQRPASTTSECAECGDTFETDNPKKEFCSSKCQQDFNNYWKGQGPRLAKAFKAWRVGRKPGSMGAACRVFSDANKAHKKRREAKKGMKK